jgi:hypothetical protein
MFKFEMQLDLGNKLTVETSDFDVIAILKDFVEFQESQGWVECFDFSTAEYDDEEDETADETISGQTVQ